MQRGSLRPALPGWDFRCSPPRLADAAATTDGDQPGGALSDRTPNRNVYRTNSQLRVRQRRTSVRCRAVGGSMFLVGGMLKTVGGEFECLSCPAGVMELRGGVKHDPAHVPVQGDQTPGRRSRRSGGFPSEDVMTRLSPPPERTATSGLRSALSPSRPVPRIGAGNHRRTRG